MNKRKGFFRVTLVLSILIGIITPFWFERIVGQIVIHVKFPDDWADMSSQQKQNHIDSLLSNNIRFSLLSETSQLKIREDLRKEYSTKVEMLLQDFRKKYPEYDDLDDLTLAEKLANKFPEYSDLARKVGILNEAKRRKLLTPNPLDVFMQPGWKESSLLGFLGFASIWLIYLFIRWVIIAFVIGGFKDKTSSTKG